MGRDEGWRCPVSGMLLDARDTQLLHEVVEACGSVVDEPVSWDALVLLGELLDAVEVTFAGFDSLLPHAWFHQCLTWDGRWLDHETPLEALDNPFWQNYWHAPCSWADRTGDYTTVTTLSDQEPLAESRARLRELGADLEREITACVASRTPGRHLRLLAWRGPGSDFTSKDRLVMELLRPHFALAYGRAADAHNPSARLTRRQLEVLRMVADGYINHQIARRLNLSEGTVRTHLSHIYERLGVTSRTAAVQRVFGG